MAVAHSEAHDLFVDGPSLHEVPPRRSGRVHELEDQIDRLREQMRIAVVYGGDKSVEGAVINPTFNPRSWKSYRAVAEDIAQALKRLGFAHVELIPEDMRLGEHVREAGIHFAWLNTGGVQGYNPVSHAAAMLEMFGIPYVGHDPLAAGMLDNKHIFKRELLYLNLPTAPFITWHLARGPFRPQVNTRFLRAFHDYWGPFIVKPVSGRASLHVHPVDEVADLGEAVAEVFEMTQNHVLIEAFLPGPEYCVAIGGRVTAHGRRLTRRSEPFVFSPIERVLGDDERIFTSMDVRPIRNDRMRPLDPEEDGTVIHELSELARVVAVELGLEALVRLDVRTDVDGKLRVLEANPKPDLKRPSPERTSLACAGLAAAGMDYDDLILSQLADRLDLLFSQRRGSVSHLAALLA